MCRIVCVANPKSGVGKTATAINLSVGLARTGLKTLLVDLDPHCGATLGIGGQPAPRHPLVIANDSLDQYAVDVGELELLPGSASINDNQALAELSGPQQEQLVEEVRRQWSQRDMVIIDCPSSLAGATVWGLAAADEILLPMQSEYFAMEGLPALIEIVRSIMRRPNHDLDFAGVLLTKHDESNPVSLRIAEEVREFFGEIVFETSIPPDMEVAHAAIQGKPVMDYAPRSRGARAFIELCQEITAR